MQEKGRSFFDCHGRRILPGKKVGSGGEGDVYDIGQGQRHVAKIYHKPLSMQKQEKLRLMVQGCNEELEEISAWPVDLVYDGPDGPVCGFLMPKVTDGEPVHKVYGPTHRKLIFPTADWKFLVRAAKNLAAAFDVMHHYGYVIGDVNEGNILVSNHACVTLIDCDSVQVRTSGTVYYCEVGVAQFTPPEIQNSKDFRIERSKNHDNFGLAILIFQLLFMGRHPFAGVYSGKEDMPIERAIAEYRFAFSRDAPKRQMSPPPNSVGLAVVPPEVARLFEQAFGQSHGRDRPSAGEWWTALDSLERKLKRCSADSGHVYLSGLPSCPWCRLEQESGAFLFLSPDAVSKFDLVAEWKKVTAFPPPGQLPVISPDQSHPAPVPLPPDLERSFFFTKVRMVTGLALAIWCGLVLASSLSTDYGVTAAVAVAAAFLLLFPGKEAAEKRRRRTAFESARYRWDLIRKKWTSDAGDEAYRAKLQKLQVLRNTYASLEKQYTVARGSFQHTAKERQLAAYLGTCFIDSYNFLRIGANRKAVLRSFGIETAADINRGSLQRITEFGDIHRDELLSWRTQMEERFRFDPSKGLDPADRQNLIHRFQPKMRPVERELRLGIESLNQVRQKILQNRARYRPAVERSARELAQAAADLEVFTLLKKP
ncbi:MAG: hypothetical protein ABSB80_12595 [Methanoregula sp.]|jgi:DNA-binding helix-hairpin-helix protein with protein kinase domain|uniref:helix-hairpin-helix domain-containing protein n=1 Tax=Methanoregula sp. TaxID=2052170 RepID=UPI003D0A03F8